MTEELLEQASTMIREAGLNPNSFCLIRNQCFAKDETNGITSTGVQSVGARTIPDRSAEALSPSAATMISSNTAGGTRDYPFWYVGQQFFSASRTIANELADWFGDPSIVSDW